MSALPPFARSKRRGVVHATSFAVLVVVVALFACKKKSGQLIGSCDRRSTEKLQSICEDAIDDFVLERCSSAGYDVTASGTKSEKACDRTGAIGGCKNSSSTTWYFPAKTIRKVEHIAYFCSNGTVVGVDGAPLSGVTPAKTASSAELEAESAIPAYKSKVEAKLAVIEQIAKKLPSPATKARTPANDLEHLLHAHEEDLATLGKMPKIDYRAKESEVLSACARMVKNGDVTGVTDVSTNLRDCSTAEHLVVIRTRSLTQPKQVGGINQYEAGRATGDVLVFELSGGKLVGSAPYSATSSRDVTMKWETFDADLRKDLLGQLASAWAAAIKTATSKP
jgi:hypothetical protein